MGGQVLPQSLKTQEEKVIQPAKEPTPKIEVLKLKATTGHPRPHSQEGADPKQSGPHQGGEGGAPHKTQELAEEDAYIGRQKVNDFDWGLRIGATSGQQGAQTAKAVTEQLQKNSLSRGRRFSHLEGSQPEQKAQRLTVSGWKGYAMEANR